MVTENARVQCMFSNFDKSIISLSKNYQSKYHERYIKIFWLILVIISCSTNCTNCDAYFYARMVLASSSILIDVFCTGNGLDVAKKQYLIKKPLGNAKGLFICISKVQQNLCSLTLLHNLF